MSKDCDLSICWVNKQRQEYPRALLEMSLVKTQNTRLLIQSGLEKQCCDFQPFRSQRTLGAGSYHRE